MRRIAFCLIIITLAFNAFGQNTKKMNSIKRSTLYLYAEATMASPEEAYETAKELLLIQVKDYYGSKKSFKDKDILVKNINQMNDSLQFRRGDMYKVFLYVKKTDITKADNAVLIENDTKPTVSEVVEENPVITAPAEVPQDNTYERNEALLLPVAWQQDVIDQLLAAESFAKARALLNRLKAEFKVKQTGQVSSSRNIYDKYLLIGQNGNVLTVLGPEDNGRTDFANLVKTSLDAFQNVDIVWFTLAK